ncbi:MAG: carbohydrate kinase family protein [Desulfopila sp.]
MKIVISGSLAYDRIMDFPESFADHLLPEKLNEINVCFMVNGMTENFGGTAGNIGYALKLMQGTPEISACLGKDSYRYIEWLQKNNIATTKIHVREDEWTAGANITTDIKNNQITCFNPGAMRHSSNLDVGGLASNTLLIVSPGNIDDMINYPQQAMKNGIKYIFDPGQAIPMLQKDNLLDSIDGCYLLMVNDYELNLILDKTGLQREEIIERAGSAVITLGEEGSLVYHRTGSTKVPTVTAPRVADPTGAGDAYRGGLLSGLTQGMSLQDSCIRGSTCASFAVENYGTQTYAFTEEEFSARLATVLRAA